MSYRNPEKILPEQYLINEQKGENDDDAIRKAGENWVEEFRNEPPDLEDKSFLNKDSQLIEEIVAGMCGDKATNDFRTNIIMAAFRSNELAHNGYYNFYYVKSCLLEYVFMNKLWGEPPYDSYGIGYDQRGNAVAYFDVPNCGQVSFHLVDTDYSDFNVPSYNLKWCGVRNNEFPSYNNINSIHNFLKALGYNTYGSFSGGEILVESIDFSKIPNDKTNNTCYLMDVSAFYYRGRYPNLEYWNFESSFIEDNYDNNNNFDNDENTNGDDNTPIDEEEIMQAFVNSVVTGTVVLKVNFSKANGITSVEKIEDYNEKAKFILKSDNDMFWDTRRIVGILKDENAPEDHDI